MGMIDILMKLLEIRNMMMFNLVLQIILTVLSPLRKSSTSSSVNALIWAAYTVTGLAADYALGLVTQTAMGSHTPDTNRSFLVALWGPFIFLQMMGPDTITTFSMEDSKTALRTCFRAWLTFVILGRAIMVLEPKSRLSVIIFFVCVVGFVKYYERNMCLDAASLTQFTAFTKPFVLRGKQGWARRPRSSTSPDAPADVARDALMFFQTFKGVFANVVFTPQQLTASRNYFLRMVSTAGALAVVEIELNLAYDVLYTKALMLAQPLGLVYRLIVVIHELVAFFVWVSVDKSGFDKVDVRVTYTLFLYAMLSDLVSLLTMKLSDWAYARVPQESHPDEENHFTFLRLLSNLKKKFYRRRWSGCVSRYSLIMCCTSKSSLEVEKMLDWLKIKDLVYGLRNMSPTRLDDKLGDFLFRELRSRSWKARDQLVAKQMSSAKGDWILRHHYDNDPLVSKFTNTWFTEEYACMEFGNVVLLWHVATELCYHVYASSTDDGGEEDERYCTKVISDYLAYLLVREQTMLSEVAVHAKVTFQHTCEEVAKILITGEPDIKDGEKLDRACRMIIKAGEDQVGHVVDQSKGKLAVLVGACNLSNELKALNDQGVGMWEVMSKVWVELLCYAACNCKASAHAAQLCKGGQLVTLVWMLMAHLGLSNRF